MSRDLITEMLLRGFCAAGDDTYGDIRLCNNYKGDLTQRGDDQARLRMGEEAYLERDWDTLVCNGRVLLVFSSWKCPFAKEGPVPRFQAEWYWCFDQMRKKRDVVPESEKRLSRLAADVRADLQRLPELEFVRVLKVHFWSHGRGKPKAKSMPAPKGLVFFNFAGGGQGVAITQDYKRRVSK
jgi:hypothetical protein